MSYETIRLSVSDAGIAVCTFDRPEVRNALSEVMVDEIHDAMQTLAADRSVSVLIFSGTEKVFVSGADIAELRDRDRHDALRRINNGLFAAIEAFPQPTIAAVRGWALGGGCELAAACDLRVAGKGARFGQPEVSLGIMPGAGATYRLPKLIGLGNARDLVLTGRIVDADEAFKMGLVNRLVEDKDVLEAATTLAEQIASNGRLAVQFSKMALNASDEMSTATGMALESTVQALLFEDEEKRNRMTNFLERKNRKRS